MTCTIGKTAYWFLLQVPIIIKLTILSAYIRFIVYQNTYLPILQTPVIFHYEHRPIVHDSSSIISPRQVLTSKNSTTYTYSVKCIIRNLIVFHLCVGILFLNNIILIQAHLSNKEQSIYLVYMFNECMYVLYSGSS